MNGAAGVKGQKRTSVAGLIVGLGLMVSLCVALWVVFFLIPAVGLIRARSWTPSTCEILSSRVASYRDSSGDGGTAFWVEVRYRWNPAGVAYTGDRYDLYGRASTGAESDSREIVRGLPPGRTVTCYVNSRDPREAVIDRDVHPEQFVPWALSWLLLGATFIVVRVTVRYYRGGGTAGAGRTSGDDAL
jgi:hypothetical protein